MDGLLPDLTLAESLSDAPYTEFHSKVVTGSIDDVWRECLEVTAKEVRLLGPLMALRSLPSLLRGRHAVSANAPKPLLEVFMDEHFVLLRRDDKPVDGRAVVLFGAAGKFWSVVGNAPIDFDSPQAFLDFETPDFAKTVARLEAIDRGDGTVTLETETWVVGTDAASTKKFGPYWKLIRLPSGAIRRSWLAAIARRLAD